MVSRRGALGAIAGLGAALLTGCGFLGGGSLVSRLSSAVDEVEGARAEKFDIARDARVHRALTGSVRMDPAVDARRVFDEAMKQIITVLHGAGEGDLKVGGVIGTVDGKTAVTVEDLNPDVPQPNMNLDLIPASALFARYGLS